MEVDKMAKLKIKSNNVVEIPMTGEQTTPEIKEVLDLTPHTLDKLIETAKGIEADSHDFNVSKANSENVRFNDLAGLTFRADDGEVRSYDLSRYSLGQLSSKIGVPARYIEKCVSSGRIELAQDNVNSWLEDFNKNLFIREYAGRIRGVLSDRYSVCDTPDILKVVDDAVDLNNYKIKGSYLNEERFHLRLVGRNMLPIDGEDLFAGLFIDSSDVGRSILTVKFGIYKQVCTNGLVIARAGGTLFEQKHIGITAEEFHAGLSKSLSVIDELTEHAVEFVKLAKTQGTGYNLKSLDEKEMEKFIRQIRQTTTLPEASAEKVITLMQTKYDDTKWGLINGITEVAQDFTLERRLDLERIAGNLLVA
jgi:hypothetical protein